MVPHTRSQLTTIRPHKNNIIQYSLVLWMVFLIDSKTCSTSLFDLPDLRKDYVANAILKSDKYIF